MPHNYVFNDIAAFPISYGQDNSESVVKTYILCMYYHACTVLQNAHMYDTIGIVMELLWIGTHYWTTFWQFTHYRKST